MKETTPAAMPPCFDRWCKKFDDLLRTKAQKSGARNALPLSSLNSIQAGKRQFKHYIEPIWDLYKRV